MSPEKVQHTTRLFRESGCTDKLLSYCLRVKQGGSLYHFHDGLWYDQTRRQTHDILLTTKSSQHSISDWKNYKLIDRLVFEFLSYKATKWVVSKNH